MKTSLSALAFAAVTNALVARQNGCCSGITVYGLGEGGQPLRQLSDGQNRIGDNSLPAGSYCLNDGGFTDGNGRGCILTPPTTQYQCDQGASAAQGFSISCNGTISHNGESTFYACPTQMNGGYNIYSKTLAGEPGCIRVWLNSNSCHGQCPSTPPPAPPAPVRTSTVTAPCPTPTPEECTGQLTGNWEFPHLIVPIDSANANKAYGTSYNGTAEGTISSIFNFDIPPPDAGMTCSLDFLFPMQDQLETSAYEFSGSGEFEFAILQEAASADTTYATAPKSKHSLGTFKLEPGTAVNIAEYPCPANSKVGFWMSPVGDSSLNYFQDSNPCPLGLYVTAS